MINESRHFPELFGSMVFNEETMKERLSPSCYNQWKQSVSDGTPLEISTANEIAEAMKQWAVEHGATHYTHWFQPMTGVTAEKHDSFISPAEKGRIVLEFSGKELVRGEPDASSFPSGGLRATFEARGYTAWDPTSFAFIKEKSLCIPTIFCSYSGHALDKKTPLLRSMDAVSKQAVRILRLFGDTTTTRVIAQVGAEQEYFLLDKKLYNRREDLIMTGRTLFGSKPPRGQELEDHYFGAIRPRVAAYMQDLDNELWKLGVLSKTKHNEVAPSQHEMAPIYSDANSACDQNQITMEIMKKVADRHGLVCLLHEKPFAGVNGSGKHNNWSLSTNTGENLLSPGKHPEDNLTFQLEAPPAVVSIFLGSELSAVVDSIIHDTTMKGSGRRNLDIGVDVMPPIPQDNTDRNRTSPMAFTGNKFEFRMPGSSLSISGPNIVLNTMMAHELMLFADELENSENFDKDVASLIRRELTAHRRIIFDGNGYDESWLAEAKLRGLSNFSTAVDALPAYIDEKNIRLFTDHAIYTREEVHARYNIHVENYTATIEIEARTMIDMLRKDILPAVSEYGTSLCRGLEKRSRLGLPSKYEENNARNNCMLSDCLHDACIKMEKDLREVPADPEAAMHFCHDVIVPDMNECRSFADELETITERTAWPFPTYSDLLFSEG